MLRIHVLGGFLIEDDGRSLPPMSSTAGRSLLAYLITYRGRRHTRDLLSGTFWPDHSESSARKRLSQALWQIHAALRSADADESIIDVTPSQVSFNVGEGSYWLDAEEFERLAGSDHDEQPALRPSIGILEQAVNLYRGDFLAGFYDDWMLLERQRLSDMYLHSLERLVTLHKARSDYRSALSSARRIVLEDPLRESAHREVMRLNFLLGRSTEALQQYETCIAILREDLAVGPSARTKRLRDEIVQLRDKGDRPFVPGVDAPLIGDPRKIPLIGRSMERTSVVRRIEDTLVGRGSVVLVEGESGIGKTRFLDELVKDAHWRGVSVLWATADQRTHLRPYHVIGEAFRSGITPLRARQLAEILDEPLLTGITRVAPEIAEFFPDLSAFWDLPPSEVRTRLRRSLRCVLVALGELSAHALFIDDAQWMDSESLAVLQELLSDMSQVRMMIALAYRSDEARDLPVVWGALKQLDEQSHPERIVLARLGPEDTSHLIDEASAAVIAPNMSEGIFNETGGNPLFILETLRTMHESADQVFSFDVGRDPTLHETEIASGVARVIKRRLVNLEAETRVVLSAAATLGTRFDTNLLTRMSRLDASSTLRGLAQLVQRGVVIESADGYEFSHQQMRVVAGGLIRSSVRRRLHRDAALAIEAEYPDRVEDLAHHYASAGMADQAMRLAWQAGSRAVTLASYEAATRFLTQAVEWAQRAELPATDYFELLCDLESALDVLGRRKDQSNVIDLMDRVTEENMRMKTEALRRRSNVLAQFGAYSEALDVASRALHIASQVNDEEVLCATERTIGAVHSLSGSPAKAIPHLERAVGLTGGRSTEEADIRRGLGDALADLQRYDLAYEQLEDALSLYEEAGDLRGMVDVKGLLGIVSMEQGDAERAEDLYEQALKLARRLEYRRAEAVNLANLGNLAYFKGQVGSALNSYFLAAETFQTIGDRRGAALARSNAASVLHLILGDDERAEVEARTALEFFESESHDSGIAQCLEIVAGVAERNGEHILARKLLDRGLRLVEDSQHRWLQAHLLRHVSEIELATGQTEASGVLVDRARELCQQLGLTDVLPTVEGIASRVALARGDVDEAVNLARRATETLTDSTEQAYSVWYQRHLVERAAGNREPGDLALVEAWRLLEATLSDLSIEERDRALVRVPVHRAIAQARLRSWPQVIHARLPKDSRPLGRSLRDGDLVSVHLTVSDPSDYVISSRIERRRHRIRRLIAEASSQGAPPRIADLATALKVSEATLRRDLASMRGRGVQVATRGSRSG